MTTDEAKLRELGFKTKGFPHHVRRDGLALIERALAGATVTELGGHRLNKCRDAISVHVHRDYVVVLSEEGGQLRPTHFISHETFNKMFR
jgi:hypothetical protein